MSTLPVMVMATAMMAVGGGFVYYLVRHNPEGRPRGALQWAATGLATLLVVTAGLLLILSAAVYSGGGNLTGSPGRAPREGNGVGNPAPPLAFRTVGDDVRRELGDYYGQVVLLNFWATWCGPCLQELPELNDLQVDYGEAGLVVLALSDETPAMLETFVEERPLQTVTGYLPDVADVPQPFAGTLSIRPTTYVIDREGTVREFIKGARDYAFFERSIKPYL